MQLSPEHEALRASIKRCSAESLPRTAGAADAVMLQIRSKLVGTFPVRR